MQILFGERVEELLFETDENNQELAEAVGVHVTTVQRWRRGETYPSLPILLAVADHFHCSLDFLAGRTEVKLDYIPQKCPSFYDRFRIVLDKKEETRYHLTRETKIKDSYFTTWKKGVHPNLVSLVALAEYLEISVDYLVGRDR